MESRRLFHQAGIPTYETPERAVQAFLYMHQYKKNLESLIQLPSNLPHEIDYDSRTAHDILESVLNENRRLLSEHESKSLLEKYGIPVTSIKKAAAAADAVAAAGETGYPVVLKLDSPDITHKSDAGGVKLNLKTPSQVEEAFREIMESARQYDPAARVDGVSVQKMIAANGVELLLGAKKDESFGPVILFGLGGTMAEIIGDRAIGLPPLNRLLARNLIERTKAGKILKGYRNLPPADMTQLEEILIRLSQMLIDHPEIVELDINPLLSSAEGVVALDARVVVEPPTKPSPSHLCISPYPAQYECREELAGGLEVFVRPIKPTDGEAMMRLFNSLSSETILLRFGQAMKTLPQAVLSRYTQIDYDRESALVIFPDGGKEIAAVGRIVSRPNETDAELGMTVADAWQGQGLGGLLMVKLIAIARDKNIKRLLGVISKENKSMRRMAEKHQAVLTELGNGDFAVEMNL